MSKISMSVVADASVVKGGLVSLLVVLTATVVIVFMIDVESFNVGIAKNKQNTFFVTGFLAIRGYIPDKSQTVITKTSI